MGPWGGFKSVESSTLGTQRILMRGTRFEVDLNKDLSGIGLDQVERPKLRVLELVGKHRPGSWTSLHCLNPLFYMETKSHHWLTCKILKLTIRHHLVLLTSSSYIGHFFTVDVGKPINLSNKNSKC